MLPYNHDRQNEIANEMFALLANVSEEEIALTLSGIISKLTDTCLVCQTTPLFSVSTVPDHEIENGKIARARIHLRHDVANELYRYAAQMNKTSKFKFSPFQVTAVPDVMHAKLLLDCTHFVSGGKKFNFKIDITLITNKVASEPNKE